MLKFGIAGSTNAGQTKVQNATNDKKSDVLLCITELQQ